VSAAIMPIAEMVKQQGASIQEQGSAIEQLAQVIETLQVPELPPVNPELIQQNDSAPPTPPPAI
jgi:hypothetical protein